MKNKKILMIVISIILLIIVLVAIHTIRNYIILDKIAKRQTEIQHSTNYSLIIESHAENEKFIDTTSEFHYKDGKSIRNTKGKENFLVWQDNNLNEEIFINKDSNIATIHKLSSKPSGAPILTIDNSIFLAMFSLITSDEINGEKCYKIKNLSTYVSKEDGTMLRAIIMGGQDGEEFEVITNYKNWKFGEVTDEKVTRPDLSGYEIKSDEN